MSIAYQFLNSKESFPFRSTEDMICFIVDNYFELIKIYRVMKTQNLATRNKKENAHAALQAVRERKEFLDARQLTDAQKMTFEETERHLTKLREENDVHHYYGEPLEQNQLTMLILNHPILMAVFDKLDKLVRIKTAKISKPLVRGILYPMATLIQSTIEQTPAENAKTINTLKTIRGICAEAPEAVSDLILESLEINLEEHLPNNEDKDNGEYSYSFTF